MNRPTKTASKIRPATIRPLAARYGTLREKIRRLEKEKEAVAEEIRSLLGAAGVVEVDARDFRVAFIERRGTVDYKGLLYVFHTPCEAELESFRGPPSRTLEVKFAPPSAPRARGSRAA